MFYDTGPWSTIIVQKETFPPIGMVIADATTFSITTFSIKTFSIMTFSIKTLIIKG
jgi:hypothetical protein